MKNAFEVNAMKKKYIIPLSVCAIMLVLNIAARLSTAFSDFYVMKIFPYISTPVAFLSGLLPCSFGELLIAAGILLVAVGIPLVVIMLIFMKNSRRKIRSAAALTVIFFTFAPQLLTMFGASDKTLPYGVDYARIYILGSIFVLIVMGMNPFITTQGFAKISMMTTVIGAVINIILDPIFIFVFHLGVKGAALATVLSQAVGAIWILRFLSGNKTILHLKKENFKLQKEIILPCLALGISTFVMLSTESILSISFTSSLSRYGGDLAVGAMTIITSVSQLATLPLQGICQGGQPIMSYNYGAGNRDRVKKSFFTQFTVCTIFTGCFWLIMLLFPKMFAGIFSNNTELITYTAWALRIYMAGIFSLGFQVACQQSFMALGQAKVSLLLACLRKLILLIPLIFILPHFIQNKVFAVFLAEPISDILAAIITTSTFFSRFNKILDRK